MEVAFELCLCYSSFGCKKLLKYIPDISHILDKITIIGTFDRNFLTIFVAFLKAKRAMNIQKNVIFFALFTVIC